MCIQYAAPVFAAGGTLVSAGGWTWTGLSGLGGSMGTLLSVGGSVVNMLSQYQRSRADSDAARANARIANYQAADAERRGQIEEQQHRRKVAALKADQRAALAGNGVLVDEGSALDVVEDTEAMGEMDALTIRDNAAREAWGYRVDASNQRQRANDAEREGMFGMTSSLITGAGTVADHWYSYSRLTA